LIRSGFGERGERNNGAKLGRKPKSPPRHRREAIKRRAEGKETSAEIARHYDVHPSTISRLTV
jgi:transposase-like protein